MPFQAAKYTGSSRAQTNERVDVATNHNDQRPIQFVARSHQPDDGQLQFKASAQNDKIKQVEIAIIDLIEQSACERLQDAKPALAKAREARSKFEALRVMLMQQEHQSIATSWQKDDGAGVDDGALGRSRQQSTITTSVNMFDLQVMVLSNLAARCQDAKLYDESIELYMQLCKLAPPNSSPSNAIGALVTREGNRQSASNARYLLYRFGINLGNLHHIQGKHQKALKYYRLTLDRLSSCSGQRNLKLKLMHNISVSLIELESQAPGETSELTQRPSDSSVISLSLLLSDNVMQRENTKQKSVWNANHHSFGLNLILCQHDRTDLRSMMSDFEGLLDVDICHHYRELPLVSETSQLDRRVNTQEKSTSVGLTAEFHDFVQPEKDGKLGGSGNDRLHSVIAQRRGQIARCLVTACNLILDLDDGKKVAGGEQPGLKQAPISGDTFLFEYCRSKLAASAAHKSLLGELQAKSVGRLITGKLGSRRGRCKLNRAIQLLRQMNDASKVDEVSNQQSQPRTTNSALTATNLCLFNSLEMKQERLAIEYGRRAVELDETQAASWINLANCHYYQADLQTALLYYERAASLLIDQQPTSDNLWQVRYNMALVQRKLGHLSAARQQLAPMMADRRRVTSLAYNKLVLAPVQHVLSTIAGNNSSQSESGDEKSSRQTSVSILQEMIANGKQAPEVHFLLSRLLSDDLARSLSSLKTANLEHAYSLSILERLVALNIEAFDYESARRLLVDCIRNRPDQIKWYLMLAECYRRSGDYHEASKVYQETSELFPRDMSCLQALAKLASELGLAELTDWCNAKLERLLVAAKPG